MCGHACAAKVSVRSLMRSRLHCRIPFTDAVKGATVKVNLKGGTDVKIPAGDLVLLPLHLARNPM